MNNSRYVCCMWYVGSVRLKCPTSAGLAGQPIMAWMLLAAKKEEPKTSEEARSRHPQHAADMSCDSTTSGRKYTAA